VKKDDSRVGNQRKVRKKIRRRNPELRKMEREIFSDVLSKAFRTQFKTLGKISEEEKEKIEIIKLGFRPNQEGKICLKKSYEKEYKYSLFQWKEYRIKYESIRRTTLYLKLKEKSFFLERFF
jgi:hypothetical protein